MDKEHSHKLQELRNMQLKISHLFLDVMKEVNEYKLNSNNLSKRLEQLSDEAESLKKQNKILKQDNEDLKNVIEKGILVFKSLDFSNLHSFKEHKIELETLKTLFFEFSKKIETFTTGGNKFVEKEKNIEIDNTRCKLSDEEIKKQFEGLSNSNFFTNFSYEKAVDENSQTCTNSRSNTVLSSLFQNVSVIRNTNEPSSGHENDNFDSKSLYTVRDAEIHRTSPPSREIETRLEMSPVFKDFAVRKLDNVASEDCGSSSSTSLSSIIINEKFLEKSHNFMISPRGKSSHKTNEKTPTKKSSASKRTRNKLNINTPEKSPRVMLKKSNMREAEISLSGIRKFRQTLLNIDCYKKDNSKDIENSENRDDNSGFCIDNKKNEEVKIIDDEDDDFITESPNEADQILVDIKMKKSEPNLNEVLFFTPPQTSDLDFDETYISSSLLRKCNATNKRELERIIQDQTPLKRHAREISPEYDSVPFAYKREPVRKRAERMKLPGHACLECMKYYEKEFGDLDPQDLKKILNKCSRHRDKNSPTNDDTPPGYWKPYITCSSIISPNKENVSKAIIN